MIAYEYATTIRENHPITIPFQYLQDIANGSKVRILIVVDEVATTLSQLVDQYVEDEDDEPSLEDFIAEIKARPPTDHLLVPGDGRLAEYLANPVTEPDPDFDVDAWNREWQAVEAQKNAEERKYEQRELDRIQNLLS